MKKLVKKVAPKKAVSKKVVKKTTKPKSTKRVRKYANGGAKTGCPDGYVRSTKGGCISKKDLEYEEYSPVSMDAEKEVKYILSQRNNWANQDLANKVNRYPKNDEEDFFTTTQDRLGMYMGIPYPGASAKSMKDFRKATYDFYQANPNVKPYIGRLPIKKELPTLSKGGTKTSVKKYAKGGTKAKLGSGERFKALSTKIEKAYQKKGKSKSVAEKIGKATAAIIGMKKYGKAKMTKMAVKGRKGK